MVLTNTPMSGAMRGFGNEVMSFCTEQLMDEAAEKLGIDPVDIRLKNSKQAGDVAALGLNLESCYLEDCLKQGAQRFGWKERRPTGAATAGAETAAARAGAGTAAATEARATDGGRIRRGYGMCTMSHCTGAAPCTSSTPTRW